MMTTRIRIGQQNRQWPALHWCCRGAGGPLQRRRDWLRRTRHSPPAHGLTATLPKGCDTTCNAAVCSKPHGTQHADMHAQRTLAHPTIEVRVDLVHDTQRLLPRPKGHGLAAHARWYPDATAGGACRSESNRERKRMTWQRSAAERSCELAWLPWAEDAVLARALLRTCSVIGWPTLAKKSRSSSSES